MAGLTEIFTAVQNLVTATQTMAQNLKTVFPQATTSSTTAPSSAGGVTFTSSQPVGFLLVALSSGVTVKFPYYNQ